MGETLCCKYMKKGVVEEMHKQYRKAVLARGVCSSFSPVTIYLQKGICAYHCWVIFVFGKNEVKVIPQNVVLVISFALFSKLVSYLFWEV